MTEKLFENPAQECLIFSWLPMVGELNKSLPVQEAKSKVFQVQIPAVLFIYGTPLMVARIEEIFGF